MEVSNQFLDKHFGDFRGYSHLKQAYYGETILRNAEYINDVTIGFYDPDGGTSGEFCVRWYNLTGKITPCLEVFDNAWNALFCFSDVLQKMAEVDSEDITPEEFCKLLDDCGVLDKTKREID